MLFGYPGSGKTTTAKILADLTGAVRLSSDEIRLEMFAKPRYTQAEHDVVYATINQRAEELLANGKDVIYDANLNRFVHRAEKYELCRVVGARPVLFWIQVPEDIARNRAVMRAHHHLVPEDETFESMFDRVSSVLEEPRPGEPMTIIDGTEVNRDAVQKALEHSRA